MKTLAYVKGLGKIVEENQDFYSDLQALKDADAEPITPRNEAFARIRTAKKEAIGRTYGTWTTAGLEHAKGELPLLRLNSRLLDSKLAKQAVKANRNNQYFSTKTTQEYEESLEQAEKDKEDKEPEERTVIILPSRERFEITPSKNREVLRTLLKDKVIEYFGLNGNNPIPFYPVDKDTVDAQDGTLLTQLWFHSLDDRSGLIGNYGNLDCNGRFRGVQKSGKAAQKISAPSKKIKLPYTQKQVDKMENLIKRVRSGDLKASELEKVAKFLTKLRQ